MLKAENPVWRTATVRNIVEETPLVRSLELEIPGWSSHLPGQHVDVRLSLEDGNIAIRSYSIASAPEAPHVQITAERIETSRLSRFLASELRTGDTFELRGPIGGEFVWNAAMREPLFLIAGGSGIVPLMAMLRHRKAANNNSPALLMYSSASVGEIIYRNELDQLAAGENNLRVVHTLTRQQPANWPGEKTRVDHEMLARIGFSPSDFPRIYICGTTQFADFVTSTLIDIGHQPGSIRQECYGSK